MLKPASIVTGVVCLLLASVVGVFQLSNNEVEEDSGDKYSLAPACMALVRSQVNVHMHASLLFTNMAAHFDQNLVARKGFGELFRKHSDDERKLAHKWINFLNERGSQFMDFNIDMPAKSEWGSAWEALYEAILLEKDIYNQLNHIHDIAQVHCKDIHLMDFLENVYLSEAVENIDELFRHTSVLGAMKDSSLGEFLYDRHLQGLQ